MVVDYNIHTHVATPEENAYIESLTHQCSACIIDGENLNDLWTIQSITNKQGKGETVIAKLPFGKKKMIKAKK